VKYRFVSNDTPVVVVCPGTYVDTLLANDGDAIQTPGGQVKYRFVSGSRDQFNINDTTGVVTVGPITPLSYATQSLYNITVFAVCLLVYIVYFYCGSVAEWLVCWTQAQKGLGSNHSRDAVG